MSLEDNEVNTAQKIVLGIGLLLFVGAGFFYVPWLEVYAGSRGEFIVGPAGYAPLYDPPVYEGDRVVQQILDMVPVTGGALEREDSFARIDASRLAVQLLLVVVVTGAAVLLSSTPKSPARSE